MLAEGAVDRSSDFDEEFDALCEERAEEEEREGVGALKGPECVFCREREAVGLFPGVEARPRARPVLFLCAKRELGKRGGLLGGRLSG